MGKIPIEMTGMKFGRLKVIKKLSSRNINGHVIWKCLCRCGIKIKVSGHSLRSKNTKSCGCLKIEKLTTHGKSYSRTYDIWAHMLQRCNNKRHKAYKYYGGRGIKVCKRWLKFENFLEDMGKKPKGLSIDREDNDGNYDKKNCRWATSSEQARNRRKKYSC